MSPNLDFTQRQIVSLFSLNPDVSRYFVLGGITSTRRLVHSLSLHVGDSPAQLTVSIYLNFVDTLLAAILPVINNNPRNCNRFRKLQVPPAIDQVPVVRAGFTLEVGSTGTTIYSTCSHSLPACAVLCSYSRRGYVYQLSFSVRLPRCC